MTLDSASRLRKVAAVGAVCTAELTVLLDGTTINIALPSMGEYFAAPFSLTQWFVDSYILVFASLLLVAGTLGDRYGRRLLLSIGLVLIVVAATVGALAESSHIVLASRIIMGVGAAAVFPGTLALMSTMFRAERSVNTAITIWTAMSGLSVAIGPVVGGWLIEAFSWRAVFWINLPLCLLALVAVILWVPETRSPHSHRLDPLGQASLLVAIVALVWTIIEAPHRGWLSSMTVAGVVVTAAAIIIFVWHERRTEHPMVDFSVFARRRFSVPALSISLLYLLLFGFLFLITQYFQAVRGWGPLQAGLAVLPVAVAFAMGAALSEAIARFVGHRETIYCGFALVAIGFELCSLVSPDSNYWLLVVPAMVLLAVGGAFVQGPATVAIMNAVPSHKAGLGSAVNDTTREVGAALGVAIFGSVVSSVYRPRVVAGVDASGINADTVNAAGIHVGTGPVTTEQASAAREFLESSVLAVPTWLKVPVPQQAQPIVDRIVDTARWAFVDGISIAAWVSVALSVAAAIAVLVLMPARGPSDVR